MLVTSCITQHTAHKNNKLIPFATTYMLSSQHPQAVADHCVQQHRLLTDKAKFYTDCTAPQDHMVPSTVHSPQH